MKKSYVLWLIVLLFFVTFLPKGRVENPVTLHALFLSSDYFVSQLDTYPVGKNNVEMMSKALLKDTRGYENVTISSDRVASKEAFSSLVKTAFSKADENDICMFYLSTHGISNEDAVVFLLSDGENEVAIDAKTLKETLDMAKGTKVLLLDFCHSGAMINKGETRSSKPEPMHFVGDEYKILTSSQGTQDSWNWNNGKTGEGAQGGSYFTSILAQGLTIRQIMDRNHDKCITLWEMAKYMQTYYAPSISCVYPQEETETVLFAYDAILAQAEHFVSPIYFDKDYFKTPSDQVHFSFRVNQDSVLLYQLVYDVDGRWDFANIEHFYDNEGEKLQAGTYHRTLTLSLPKEEADKSGYVMLLLFTIDDEGAYHLQASKLFAGLSSKEEMALSICADASFSPENGEELVIDVNHDNACFLTVSVLDEAGETLCYIAYDALTMPNLQNPKGTEFYWDGKLRDGTFAKKGAYRIKAETHQGEKNFSVQTTPVIVK